MTDDHTVWRHPSSDPSEPGLTVTTLHDAKRLLIGAAQAFADNDQQALTRYVDALRERDTFLPLLLAGAQLVRTTVDLAQLLEGEVGTPHDLALEGWLSDAELWR